MIGSQDRWDQDETLGVGFIEFGQTSKKLWLFEKSGPSCFTEEKCYV